MTSMKSGGSSETRILMGNYALCEGALAAGCRYYSAYPITPANEVSELMSSRMVEEGGIFEQPEDEICALASVIGASWAGAKAMTATGGPGFTLMTEHIGQAVAMEVPLVIQDIQRPGPGGGGIQETGDGLMQVKWGAHGDNQVICIAPNSCQEMYDLTIEAFNLAGKYRVPVVVLSDALLGHMYETVEIPSSEALAEMVEPWPEPSGDPKDYNSFTYEDPTTGELVIPPTPRFGTPYQPRWAVSVPHGPKGGMTVDPNHWAEYIHILNDKILRNKESICRYESRYIDDAEIVLVCFGSVSRPSLGAVKQARAKGIKVGYVRLITLWPMPDHIIKEMCKNAKQIVVPEMSYGQLSREVERAVGPQVPVHRVFRAVLHDVEDILQKIEEAAR